ncbi:hypothetical protein FEM48_ZijujUnG0117400 [Ziziphus jujuba var. spinosa]|uniref:Uncharacterized protein n=1 Tax=Ziziphus jujuba var. spinosa TaxID=714518 RepID=A0A978U7V8_ZIZJJ|nr:hypothetical protein FEM48_ZijujUnG0117400 [Ziziphus jujuba var. spinosa]
MGWNKSRKIVDTYTAAHLARNSGLVSSNGAGLTFGANQGPNNGHGSYDGFPNQFQATEPHYHPPVSGLQEQDFQHQVFTAVQQILGRKRGRGRTYGRGGGRNSKATCQLYHTYGHSTPYCYKRFDSQFMRHTTANSGYNSNFQYNPQSYVPSQPYGQQQVVTPQFESPPQHSAFPLPASHYPSFRSQAYNNNQNQSLKYLTLVIKRARLLTLSLLPLRFKETWPILVLLLNIQKNITQFHLLSQFLKSLLGLVKLLIP